jgi:hypothetical protein
MQHASTIYWSCDSCRSHDEYTEARETHTTSSMIICPRNKYATLRTQNHSCASGRHLSESIADSDVHAFHNALPSRVLLPVSTSSR